MSPSSSSSRTMNHRSFNVESDVASTSNHPEQRIQRVVLVGGGHAHAQVIKSLNKQTRPSNVHVTLIDPQRSASYSGMVPGAVSKLYDPEETLLHLEPLCDWAGIDFVNDQVVDIDLDAKCIYVKDEIGPIPYDVCSLDIGSASRGLKETPGAWEYTIPTRPISKLVERIDRAEQGLLKDEEYNPKNTAHVVCIGGGAAGIELSMSMTARWQPLLGRRRSQVTLLDAGMELLPDESPANRAALQRILEERNICVRHDCHVQEITADEIQLTSGERIPFTHCIWATGAGAHPLAERLRERGLSVNHRGWIRVGETLQSKSHPHIFAAGDCSHIEIPGRPYAPPKAGVYAVRAGPVLIENLTRYLQQQQAKNSNNNDDISLVKYVPQDDFLKLLVCGDGTALGFRFGFPLHGRWVMQMKDHIDQMFMNLFKPENLPSTAGETPNGDAAGRRYDTAQYDAEAQQTKYQIFSPEAAAHYLRRTDDKVDYMQAWAILRHMMENDSYRQQVLNAMEEAGLLSSVEVQAARLLAQ